MMFRVASILLLLCLAESGVAQTPTSSDGSDYYIGYFIGPKPLPAVSALVCAYTQDTVSFYTFNTNGTEQLQSQTVLAPHTSASVPLNMGTMLAPEGVPSYSSYHVKATAPISLQIYADANNGTELYLALPSNIVGTDYRCMSFANQTPIDKDSDCRGVIEIIAVEDNTVVSILPACPTMTVVPPQVMLMRGQVYRFRSASAYNDDLTGTDIHSSNPVVVLNGHEGASLPDLTNVGQYRFKLDDVQNPLVEQARPTEYWVSHSYPTVPFDSGSIRTAVYVNFPGSMLRAIAAPQSVPAGSLDSIGWLAYRSSDLRALTQAPFFQFDNVQPPASLSCDIPVDCIQFDYYRGAFSSIGITHGYSAPMMMNIIPPQWWKNEYMWRVPGSSQYHTGQYISIIYDAAGPPTILNNGVKVPWSQSSALTYPDYPKLRCASIKVQPGTYWATASAPFIVYSYGRKENNYKVTSAYGAPCGMGGIDWTVTSSSILVDSSCAGWVGTLSRSGPSYAQIRGLTIFDVASAKALHVKPSVNMSVSVTQIDDTTWHYSLRPLDILKSASGMLYMSTEIGLQFVRSFTYTPPDVSLPKPISLSRILIGRDSCITLEIVNRSDSNTLTIDSIGLRRGILQLNVTGTSTPLPDKIAPGDSLLVTVCARPDAIDTLFSDTVLIQSDCHEFQVPVAFNAIAPRVNWLSTDEVDSLECGMPDTVRVWLINDNLKDGQEIMRDVHIEGPDAAEFRIVANQLGYDPMVNFPMDPGQKIWIDVAFTPDMSKPAPARWADRHATLVATNYLRNDPKIQLTATIVRPALAVDESSLDLGSTTVGVTRSATVTVRNTGNAPLSISDIRAADSRLVVSGLTIGDTLLPGEERIVTVTLSSSDPDSIVTSLIVRCNEDCADPQEVTVRLVVKADPKKQTSIGVERAAFAEQFTCQQRSATARFVNTGEADVELVSADIIGDANNVFAFSDGSTHLPILQTLQSGENMDVAIRALPRLSGASTATLVFTWDSLGSISTSTCPLYVNAAVATASLQVSADRTGLVPGATFNVPVTLRSAPASGVTEAVVSLAYRGDLFAFRSIASTMGAQVVSNNYQPDGTQILTIVADDPGGLSDGTLLCTLTFETMLTLEDSTRIDVTDARFLHDTDSLCVDWRLEPGNFYRSSECGDSLIGQVLRGRTRLSIEATSPNPAREQVTVLLRSGIEQTADVVLIDPLGRTIVSRTLDIHPGATNVDLDLNSVSSGPYTLQVRSRGAQSSWAILHVR
jgi:hypothetical protein